MKNKTCLFLGYNSKKTKLIDFLKSKKIIVTQHQNKILSKKLIRKYDFIISFGYRKIIPIKILSSLKRPIINLHISYLPYNRGAYSNFWSFLKNTPKGVSIHEIDKGIDTGDILFRKKITFTLNKNTSFKSTYKILFNEIEKLFKKNYKLIVNGNYKKKKAIIKKKKLNLKSELPKNFNWNISILKFLKTYKT